MPTGQENDVIKAAKKVVNLHLKCKYAVKEDFATEQGFFNMVNKMEQSLDELVIAWERYKDSQN